MRNTTHLLLTAGLLFTILSSKAQNIFEPRETVWQNLFYDYNGFFDIDNDGDLDILASQPPPLDQTLYWIKNNAGIFEQEFNILYDVGTEFENVVCFDIDQDGDEDILMELSGLQLGILVNNGNQNFALNSYSLPNITGGITAPNPIKIGQMNNDTLLDIIVVYSNNRSYTLLNDGFNNFPSYYLNPSQIEGEYMSLVDYTGDGVDDIVSGASLSRLFTNDGQGVFSNSGIAFNHTGEILDNSIDIDGDGLFDIVSASDLNLGLSNIYLYENNGMNTFTSHTLTITGGIQYPYFDDFDNDGDLDLFYSHLDAIWTNTIFNDTLVRRENLGNFVFDAPVVLSGNCLDGGSSSGERKVIDLDQDGDLDLYWIPHSYDYESYYMENLGNNSYGIADVMFSGASRAEKIFVEDIDNDGHKDIISSNNWLDNDGAGNYIVKGLDGINLYERSVWMDMNNDGKPDVVSQGPNYWPTIYFNSPLGNSWSFLVCDSAEIYNSLAAGDLDGDGDNDLIGLNDHLSWYENLGNGNFSQTTDISVQTALSSDKVICNDIDLDGDLDLLTSTSNVLKVFKNDGNANFTLSYTYTYSAGNKIHINDVQDINGDNVKDILFDVQSNSSTTFFSVRALLGVGNSYNTNSLYLGISGRQIKWIDFDYDGDIDIFIASNSFDQVAYIANDGLGNFVNPVIIDSGYPDATGLELSDIDGDGDLDVIVSSYNENNVSVYRSNLSGPSISGSLYWDENNNKTRESSEIGIVQTQVFSSPLAFSSINNISGRYLFSVDTGEYTISYLTQPNWILNTDSSTYQVNITDSLTSYSNIDFGFLPVDSIISIDPYIVSGFTRCDTAVDFYYGFHNSGTAKLNGTMLVKVDSFIDSIYFAVPPDTIINSFEFGWHFNALYPGHNFERNNLLEMPGVASGFNLGDSIQVQISIVANAYNYLLTDTSNFIYEPIVLCSYDPNDKITSPDRPGTVNETLFEEELTYTIRFQNTGNSYAQNLILIDTIDNQLDLNSLRILSSSHSDKLTVQITNDSIIRFRFNNIFLPDSASSPLGSQGFVCFKINERNNLPEGSEVRNSASIYFDTNPPIHTNETLNTFVNFLSCTHNEITTVNLCPGETYTLENGNIVTSGVYFDTIFDPFCDTIIQTEVIQNLNTSFTQVVSACDYWQSPNGNLHSTSGAFYDTLVNENNCDSILTTNLIILNSSAAEVDTTICDSYLMSNGTIINSAGTYFDTLTNQLGCDSILTINLSIGNTQSELDTLVCDLYSLSDGSLLTVAGIYIDTLVNSLGCDSILQIDLSIGNSNSVLFDTASYSYASPSNLYNWTESGTYFDTITNYLGCDSLITINLIIVDPTSVKNIELNGFTLYPNPANDYFTLFLNDNYLLSGSVELTIIDMLGRNIKTVNINHLGKVNVNDLEDGMYVVSIRDSEDKIFHTKIDIFR